MICGWAINIKIEDINDLVIKFNIKEFLEIFNFEVIGVHFVPRPLITKLKIFKKYSMLNLMIFEEVDFFLIWYRFKWRTSLLIYIFRSFTYSLVTIK